jgi:hypothetical protein
VYAVAICAVVSSVGRGKKVEVSREVGFAEVRGILLVEHPELEIRHVFDTPRGWVEYLERVHVILECGDLCLQRVDLMLQRRRPAPAA